MADEQKVVEAVKNCAGCKKPVKRAKRFYRNGKYYCNVNCWKKAKSSASEAPAAEAKG